MNNRLEELCWHNTALKDSDIQTLAKVAEQLPIFADLTGNNIFIDVLNQNHDALVIAQANPPVHSLYTSNVVGALALACNEPAVYNTLQTASTNQELKGISQEGVAVSQTAVPIFNPENKVIGVLISERDISQELRREEQVELLSQTAERLSNTLLYLSRTESTFEDWIGNGLFVLNRKGIISYANKEASRYFTEYTGMEAIGSHISQLLPGYTTIGQLYDYLAGTVELPLGSRVYQFRCHPLRVLDNLDGAVISIQDVTDLRKKEQELNQKSTVILEIHHRVKNNLQNIAALLELQKRRSDSEIIKSEFSTCINRIISIATVYDVFAHQLEGTIDLKELAERISSGLLATLSSPDSNILTSIKGQSVLLSNKQAVPVALVINELITNSIEHGIGPSGQGKITVWVTENDETIEMLVIDNGVSPVLPERITGSHLGLHIVKSLIDEQLGGSFHLERTNSLTRAQVCFPKRKAGYDYE